MAIKNLIQLRKGSSSEWSATNPVLASGEPGYDLTNNIIKIGDGSTSWNSLSALSIDLDTSLVAGTGIALSYNSSNNSLSINITGDYALNNHNHIISNITDFASGVSGLLPVQNILAGTGISISSSSNNFTITNNSSIISYTTNSSFPASGVSGYYYLDSDTGRLYQWTGSYYAEIGPPISSVNNAQNAANLYLWSNFK